MKIIIWILGFKGDEFIFNYRIFENMRELLFFGGIKFKNSSRNGLRMFFCIKREDWLKNKIGFFKSGV